MIRKEVLSTKQITEHVISCQLASAHFKTMILH